jgi:hypothetical protein
MKSKVLLRVASIVMLLHNAGHMVGATTWKQSEDPAMQEVIRQMTENKFPFMGAVRSMGEYYDGYGFLSALAMLLIAAILWITSNATVQNAGIVKSILVVTAIALLLWGVMELFFFFPFAASFSLLAFLLTAIAIMKLKSQAY